MPPRNRNSLRLAKIAAAEKQAKIHAVPRDAVTIILGSRWRTSCTSGPMEAPWKKAASANKFNRLPSVEGEEGVANSQITDAQKPSVVNRPPNPHSKWRYVPAPATSKAAATVV